MGLDSFTFPRRHRPADLARVILVSFVLTFALARTLVILIMTRRLPDLFLHLGGTHVHHLNYGIFLLALVGLYLLLGRPTGRRLTVAAALYGVGLALTFDEFGMWLHLGGSYWQRASFDAVVTIAALLFLIVLAPAVSRFRALHWTAAVLVAIAIAILGSLLFTSVRSLGRHILPRLEIIEAQGPT